MSTSQTPTVCVLCGSQGKLCRSHFAPDFAVKQSKALFGDVFLSHENPGYEAQQAYRTEFLCSKCEGLFSKWEGEFRQKIYSPYIIGQRGVIVYGDWLLKLAVSLLWRAAALFLENNVVQAEMETETRKAIAIWSDYLLDKSSDPGPYQHFVEFYDLARIKSVAGAYSLLSGTPIPGGFYSGVLGGLEPGMAAGPGQLTVYVLMAGCLFWADVLPPSFPLRALNPIGLGGQIDLDKQMPDIQVIATLIGRHNRLLDLLKAASAKKIELRKRKLKAQLTDQSAPMDVLALRNEIFIADFNDEE